MCEVKKMVQLPCFVPGTHAFFFFLKIEITEKLPVKASSHLAGALPFRRRSSQKRGSFQSQSPPFGVI